jgi:hypothetical protein
VREALSWLSPRQKFKFIFLIGLNSSLSLLDLLGVAAFALLGTIAIRGVQSIGLSPRTKEILEFLNLDDLTNQGLVSFLAVIASTLLISKTLISVVLNRKTQMFLFNTSARGSMEYIKAFLSRDLLIWLACDLMQRMEAELCFQAFLAVSLH